MPKEMRAVFKEYERFLNGWLLPGLERVEIDESWRSILPFPCPAGWRHLDRAEAIKQEGAEQRNCLRNPSGFMNEDTYLFQVTRPIRATVSVVPRAEGGYEVAECKTACNCEVDLECLLEIRRDLRNAIAASKENHA